MKDIKKFDVLGWKWTNLRIKMKKNGFFFDMGKLSSIHEEGNIEKTNNMSTALKIVED